MKLYSYFRSSAAYRVRIALNLKQLDYDIEPVNLVSGEQREVPYTDINPQGLVPTLQTDEGNTISQSLAICEWLEVNYPNPELIPSDPYEAARVRAFALSIACDIHPLNNLRILAYLENDLRVAPAQKDDWYRHWVGEGFNAIEKTLAGTPYCFGKEPTLADAFLIPQVFNAERFNIDMSGYPRIAAINSACSENQAFRDAHPDQQAGNPNQSS